ncbi:MAG TPA: glycosyl hydrolase, partial [Bacteroidota bacterium]|nr:glycosyl hydrolase [Bacteroidota bacterium]
EDPVDGNLLFAGTEFGCFFTVDGGKKWVQLKGGLPTIAVRDIAIQKRENDLVLGTFGRGFYVLDDYTALRAITPEILAREAQIFPVRDALMYIESRPYGLAGKGFQGESFYAAPNPPFGASITYYLRDVPKTRKEARAEREKEMLKKGEKPPYPTYGELKIEDEEEQPSITFVVTDDSGNVVKRLKGTLSKGINRVTWNLRYSSLKPARLREEPADVFTAGDESPLAMPGNYRVRMEETVDGKTREVGNSVGFSARVLANSSLPASDRGALLAFQEKVASLQRAVLGATQLVSDVQGRLALIRKSLQELRSPAAALLATVDSLDEGMRDAARVLQGDRTLSSRSEGAPPSVNDLVNGIVDDEWQSSGAPTQTQIDAYSTAGDEFAPVLARLRVMVDVTLKNLESSLERLGAPWTPGRVPEWAK